MHNGATPMEPEAEPHRRTLVMGILNVTEDSFSDGGRYLHHDRAIAHAQELMAAGADLIDVGGESTRPGATRVPAEVEQQRVVPIIQELKALGIPTSVDTMRAQVAEAAVQAGASLINDVSGGLADPNMYRVMAAAQTPVCLMHWHTEAFGDAAGSANHGNVLAHVRTHLHRLSDAAMAAGVAGEKIIWDPGLGFAKTPTENWTLLKGVEQYLHEGYPVLIGASRKRFLVALRRQRNQNAQPTDADAATAALSAIAAHLGVWGVRVHNVAVSRDAIDVASSWNLGHQIAPDHPTHNLG